MTFNERIMCWDHILYWINGILGYVMIISLWLIIFPNKKEFAVDLANHLPILLVFCMGIILFNFLGSSLDLIFKRRRQSSTEKETPK